MTKINAKEAIERIKKLLFADNGQATGTGTADSTTYQLKDGTPIKVLGSLETGSQVLVSSADGDQPAPDGELELADGTTINITGGIITEVVTPQQETDDQNGGQTPDASQFASQAKLAERLAGLEEELAQIKETFGRQSDAQKELLDLVGRLAELPAEDPVAAPKSSFSETKGKQDQKMKHLVDSLQKMKAGK